MPASSALAVFGDKVNASNMTFCNNALDKRASPRLFVPASNRQPKAKCSAVGTHGIAERDRLTREGYAISMACRFATASDNIFSNEG